MDGNQEQHAREGRLDLRAYALGVRLRPRACPPNLDPALAERYGYLRPGVKWTKPTNEVEIAASLSDPAQEIIEYLQRFEPELQEIADALRRPDSHFPVHWSEGYTALLPHLAPLKQFEEIFSLRSAARLRKHDLPGAFADALTCLRLAHTLKSEPLLISQLVGFAQHAIAVRTVWEGLAGHHWDVEQLAAFQSEFARFNFQTQAAAAIRGERIIQNQLLDRSSHMERSALEAVSSGDAQDSQVLLLLRWVPGWVRQNQARLNRYDDIELRQLTDARWPANVAGALDGEAALHAAGLAGHSPYTILAHMLAPDLPRVQVKAARAQVVNQLAMVACALEQFRLEHGAYPKALSGLAACSLSSSCRDPMSGAPLRYEHEADQVFKLWSVGLNGCDDGGVMPVQKNEADGDWVWPQPGVAGPRLF
jgi:hypothetical protein